MNKWDDLAMVTFIACDVIIENTENFKQKIYLKDYSNKIKEVVFYEL